MGLRVKFNMILISVAILGMALSGYVSQRILHQNAREEVLQMAGLIMESALAVRGYTIEEIRPLLITDIANTFVPQMVPAYAAHQNIKRLRQHYPDYKYKEATLNPTNPASRATEWETEIVETFRNNKQKHELIGTHESATGNNLYMARPITIKKQSCLACHSTVEAAPPSMLARYGTSHGFGWKMGETVGAQIVSVPMKLALSRADTAFRTFMLSTAIIFGLIILILNILLSIIVLNPIRKISSHAEVISLGKLETPELKVKSHDEVGVLITSVNRLRRSLVNSMKMLGKE